MPWTTRITRWLVADRLAEMSERVAGRSRLAVWQRVAERLTGLGPTEARGYVRARALSIVCSETDRLVEQEGPRVGAIREQIIASAAATLVETIVTQLQQQRRSASPLRHAA